VFSQESQKQVSISTCVLFIKMLRKINFAQPTPPCKKIYSCL